MFGNKTFLKNSNYEIRYEFKIVSTLENKTSRTKTSSTAAALENDFKKRYKRAVKGLAAALANFGCFVLEWKAL